MSPLQPPTWWRWAGDSGEGGYVPAINLALRNDGSVVPWGARATVPTGLKNVVAVAAGDAHCIVLQAGGQVVAWLDSYNSNYGHHLMGN